MSEEGDDSAPGWEAIDSALAGLYGQREPERHYGTVLKWILGGPDPCDGLSGYKVLDQGAPHWHIVTYGLTELYAKESEDPDESGWGFELTMRLRCAPEDEDVPAWALNFLQNIARYVFNTGNVFEAGHYMNLNGPIALEHETQIRAMCIAPAPLLQSPVDSPNGQFRFLQIVGITLDELEAMQAWSTTGVLDIMRARDPMLLTNLDRASTLDDRQAATAIEEGRKRDGSSQGGSFTSSLSWELEGPAITITMGALAVPDFKRLLAGRLPYGRPFYIAGPEQQLIVEPGDQLLPSPDGINLTLKLPDAAVEAMADLEARRGRYTWPAAPGLTIVIEPTEIKDRDGGVIEVIG